MNNVKQLARRPATRIRPGHFPDQRVGMVLDGDADRGFDKRQPASWIYNILPYIGEQKLHDLDAGLPYDKTVMSVTMPSDGSLPPIINKQTAMLARIRTPLAVMNCPSRRRSTLYPLNWWGNLGYCGNLGAIAINPTSANMCARSDYATCASSALVDQYTGGPYTLQQGDDPSYQWYFGMPPP